MKTKLLFSSHAFLGLYNHTKDMAERNELVGVKVTTLPCRIVSVRFYESSYFAILDVRLKYFKTIPDRNERVYLFINQDKELLLFDP